MRLGARRRRALRTEKGGGAKKRMGKGRWGRRRMGRGFGRYVRYDFSFFERKGGEGGGGGMGDGGWDMGCQGVKWLTMG